MTAGSQEHGLFVDVVQNAQNRWYALGHLPSSRGVDKVYLVFGVEFGDLYRSLVIGIILLELGEAKVAGNHCICFCIG